MRKTKRTKTKQKTKNEGGKSAATMHAAMLKNQVMRCLLIREKKKGGEEEVSQLDKTWPTDKRKGEPRT